MNEAITYVGLDVHKRSISVAVSKGRQLEEFTVEHNAKGVKRLVRRLQGRGQVMACYEAGPTGYGLCRSLNTAGIQCAVIAPSLIPTKPGERVKTDRRDARKLARCLAAQLLHEVRPPQPSEEAARDLSRLRKSVSEDLRRAKQRLSKFLLRWDQRCSSAAWSTKHLAWVKSIRLDEPVAQEVLEEYYGEVLRLIERKKTIESRLEALSQAEPYVEPVGWLRCFRGIDTTTAMAIVTELHGFERFQHPRQLMSFLGLTPSEHSTGDSRNRGGITKAGNGYLRRLLVEAAHHARKPPRVARGLAIRRRGQPAWAVSLADRAMHRLHRRFWALTSRGKAHNKVITAIARELVGFIWAMLHRDPPTPTRAEQLGNYLTFEDGEVVAL